MSISFPSAPVAGTSIYAGGRQWTYDGTSWNLVLGGAYELQWTKTASGGETTLTGASDAGTTLTYQLGNDNVYLNGVLMARNVDYTATTGTSITFAVALNPSDVVTVVSFNQLQLASSNIATGTEPTTYTPGMVWVNTTGTAQAFNFTRWRLSVASSISTLSGADDNALSLSYTPGLEEVFINGAMIVRGLDYTASNGISISLTVGVVAGDIVEVVNPVTMTASVAVPSTTATAKGDILAATSSGTVSRLGVGSDGYLLKADSTQPTGLNWTQYPPRGTTAQRPSSPVIGDMYYDTTLQQMLNYSPLGWVAIGSIGQLPSLTGGTLFSDSTYYYRAFTSSSNLVVSTGTVVADVLVIAGGGGGGTDNYYDRQAGGGGAGGVIYFAGQSLTPGTYATTIGAGGVGGNGGISVPAIDTNGKNGSNSQFAALTLAVGGGYGGGHTGTGAGSGAQYGNAGGSGGGGSSQPGGSSTQTGTGATAYYGNAAGDTTGSGYAAGGGGAGAVGGTTTQAGGVGTSAFSSWLSACSLGVNSAGTYYIAGGGSGWGYYAKGVAGGLGGGGVSGTGGTSGTGSTGQGNGVTNTGSGGGAAHAATAGAGGSGLIIVRYTRASVGG